MPIEYPWKEPPPPGGVTEVAAGIQWLRMPLPFKLDHINLWLLEDGPGWTVVDTGVGLDDVRALWERVFAGSLRGRPITRVLVTHFHPDHMGNAAWLADRWRVELWCPQAEWLTAQVFWRSREAADGESRLDYLRQNGCDEEALEQFRKRGNHYPGLVPSVTHEFRAIRDGEVVTIGARRWRVLTMGGHSLEHACLASPEDGLLLAGDQVLPKITSNVSVHPNQPRGNPLRLYLDSLERFPALPQDTLVLPSHGLPFRGLHERVDALREHHAARLADTLAALATPKSAAEVVPVLFPQALDTHQLGFALGEALSHLHFLEADGRAVRVVGPDGIHRFQSNGRP